MRDHMIFLASRSEQENLILKRKIECLDLEFQGLRFVGVHVLGVPNSVDERTTLVVFNVQEWGAAEAGSLKQLREARYSGPVIVSAKQTTPQVLENLKSMPNVVFIEKPFDTKDLVGIARKLLTERKVDQRIHRRYHTDEKAVIEFEGRTERTHSRISNMSKGGAALEFHEDFNVKVGDTVKMKVELKSVNRVYTVPARVVWTSGRAAGVEFMGAPDVRRTLMGLL